MNERFNKEEVWGELTGTKPSAAVAAAAAAASAAASSAAGAPVAGTSTGGQTQEQGQAAVNGGAQAPVSADANAAAASEGGKVLREAQCSAVQCSEGPDCHWGQLISREVVLGLLCLAVHCRRMLWMGIPVAGDSCALVTAVVVTYTSHAGKWISVSSFLYN